MYATSARADIGRARLARASRPVLVASSLAFAFGCQGQIGTSGQPSGSAQGSGAGPQVSGSAGSAGTGLATGSPGSAGVVGTGGTTNSMGVAGTGGTTTALDCSTPKAGVARLRLLSSTQYNNTVLDLLGVTGAPAAALGDAPYASLDDTQVEQRANVAAAIASSAIATLSKWAPCTPPATGSSTACEQQIISTVGQRLYRRPLTSAEQAELKTLFDAGIKEQDFNTGVQWFLAGVLQSPDFAYQVVRPEPTEKAGEVRPFVPYDYASRLAYFIWDSAPDDQLLTAASANDFADNSKRQAQLTRMVQDSRAMRGVEQFYRRWLQFSGFSELARNPAGFDQSVVDGLSTSLLMSATQLYSSSSPNISGLFSGQSYYMNDVLRKFYGLSGSGTSFAQVAMPNQARRGILTHPALMALNARPSEDNPISRGLFLLRNVICYQVPPPPKTLTIPPLQDGDATGLPTRTRLDRHAADAGCAGCHSAIDPAGYVFGNFDEVGRYRTSDRGSPVDTSGQLKLGAAEIDGTFSSGDELLAKVANSTAARTCFAEKYLDYALANLVTDPGDTCSIQSLGASFAPSGDLKQLVISVASSDSFRMRLAEGVQ